MHYLCLVDPQVSDLQMRVAEAEIAAAEAHAVATADVEELLQQLQDALRQAQDTETALRCVTFASKLQCTVRIIWVVATCHYRPVHAWGDALPTYGATTGAVSTPG